MALAAYAPPIPTMASGVADNARPSYSVAQAVHPQPAAHKTCDICGRSFARREHLVRHRRTHTKEKPFSCTHCNARFLRADVRDKHERRCNEGYTDEFEGDRPVSVLHARSRLACDSCRKRKLRCDDVQPCRSCVSKGLLCTTSSNSRRPGRPRNNSFISNAAPTPTRPIETQEGNGVHPNVFEANHSMTLEPHAQEAAPLSAYHGGPDAFNDPEFPEFNMFGMNEQDFDFMSGLWQLPSMDIESSIDDMSFTLGNEASHFLQHPTQSFDLPMDRALTMMREHFRVRSRAPSPSRVETSQRQYSAAPRLQVYDPEIINVLLNISRVHLADSFPIFSTFEAKPGMREELCLAMAAVGGLYCTVPGSAKVAKALYNDSRRLLLEAHLAIEDAQAENPLSFAMTFILLELYGISSGNKRSYEFIEVFHGAMLDAVQLYLNQVTADENQAKMLNDAVQVLASYRVLILALPPSIAKAADDEDLRQFMSPGSTTIKSGRPGIAALTALAWMVGGRKIRGFDSQLWRSDFIELALDRWMRSQQSAGGISHNLLYHMAHIFLHSDLAFLQRYAMAHGNDRVHGGLPEPIRIWTNSRDYTVARWHAEKILLPIKKAVTASYGPQRFQDKSLSSEPPHLPYCVYFSVLIGWYGSLSGNNHKAFEVTVSDGAQLLFCLKAQVAKLLGAALHELLPAPVRKAS